MTDCTCQHPRLDHHDPDGLGRCDYPGCCCDTFEEDAA